MENPKLARALLEALRLNQSVRFELADFPHPKGVVSPRQAVQCIVTALDEPKANAPSAVRFLTNVRGGNFRDGGLDAALAADLEFHSRALNETHQPSHIPERQNEKDL